MADSNKKGNDAEGEQRRSSDDEHLISQLSLQIDERLEQTADTHNLTAINVKSILTHLLKNDQVLTMLRRSANDSSSLNFANGLKLTRNRTRELVEKGENLHWPLSPVKAEIDTNAKTFLEVTYDDDEDDDDEYLPAAEETVIASNPTEHVDGSFQPLTACYETRSRRSLCGIPIEQLEAPLFDMRPDFDLELTPLQENDEDYLNFLSSAVAGTFGHAENKEDEDSNDSEYNFLDDTEQLDRDELRIDRATKISKRELRELLSDFVELFDKVPQTEKTLEESTTDKKSQVQFAHGNENCCNDAVASTCSQQSFDDDYQPTGKEIVLNLESPTRPGVSTQYERVGGFLFGDDSTGFSATLLHDDGFLPRFSHFEKEQLNEQLRKHVQLLAQVFLSSKCTEGFQREQALSIQCLNEIDAYRSNSPLNELSYFNIFNLPFALKIVQQNWKRPLFHRSRISSTKDKRSFPSAFTSTILQSECFIYLNLLPKCLPLTLDEIKEKKRLPQFSHCEDLLLTLGYLQMQRVFSSDSTNHTELFRCIKDLCLPVRTAEALRARWTKCAHLDQSPKMMKDAKCHGKYPEISRTVVPFDCNTVVKPFLRTDLDFTPSWLKKGIKKFLYIPATTSDVLIRKLPFKSGAVSNVMSGYLTDSAGNKFSVQFDPSTPSSLKFQIPVVNSSNPAVYCKTDQFTGERTAAVNTDNNEKKAGLFGYDYNTPNKPIEYTYVNISTPKLDVENSECNDVSRAADTDRYVDNVISESCSVAHKQNLCNNRDETLIVQSPSSNERSPTKRFRFKALTKSPYAVKLKRSPTKRAINFLNRLNASQWSPTCLKKHPVTLNVNNRLWKTAAHLRKLGRFKSSATIKATSSPVCTPKVSPEAAIDVPENNFISSRLFDALDGKSRNRTKRYRTQRGNVLKSLFAYDEQLEENINDVMASGFFKALKDGLFMHQSQLENLFNVVSAKANDTHVFDALLRILSEKPRPHQNLCDFMTMFLRSEQSLDLNRCQLHRNQQTALNILIKLERYMGSQKYRTLLKTFFRRVKSYSGEWTCKAFYNELNQTFNVAEYSILWQQLKELFDDEACDNRNFETDDYEMVDESALLRDSDDYEDVCFSTFSSVDNDFSVQRLCSCRCHKNSDLSGRCNSCNIKFRRGKVYLCKTGRFLPAVVQMGHSISLDNDVCQILDETLLAEHRYDEVALEESPTFVATLESNHNIRRLMNFVDVVEKCQHHFVEHHLTPSPKELPLSMDNNEILLSNLTASNDPIGSGNVWTEDSDRYLLRELRNSNNFEEACQLAAQKLQISHQLVKERMHLLIEMLEND